MSEVSPAVLPIPDQPQIGLRTYDAKDPDTALPPIEPLLPDGAPSVLVILLDDIGSQTSQPGSVAAYSRDDGEGSPTGSSATTTVDWPSDESGRRKSNPRSQLGKPVEGCSVPCG